jgi:hypothetical protein
MAKRAKNNGPDRPPIDSTNQILTYIHCALCVADIQEGRAPYDSPLTYSRYSVGWTPRGLQVWCNRHDCNVANVDFEGAQHPAITTRRI